MDDNLDLFPTPTTCQVGRLLASDIGRVSKWGQINSQTEISVNAWPAYFIPPTGQAHLPNKRAIVASIVQRGRWRRILSTIGHRSPLLVTKGRTQNKANAKHGDDIEKQVGQSN